VIGKNKQQKFKVEWKRRTEGEEKRMIKRRNE
jgi:hypothetical protein